MVAINELTAKSNDMIFRYHRGEITQQHLRHELKTFNDAYLKRVSEI